MLVALAVQLAVPALASAASPGPPNVEVVPPDVILDGRGGEPVTFVPGVITFTYTDGSTNECVIDPAAPPNPCSEVTSAPGPPNVDITPPQAIMSEEGGLLGFIPGLILITFSDGSQLSCMVDPALPPSPCGER
jgi:hypothetical protein